MRKPITPFLTAFSIAASTLNVGAFCLIPRTSATESGIGQTYNSADTLETESSTHLEGVEVRATREADAVKSAVPVHRLDAAKMLKSGVTDIADAIRRIPGVNLRDYGGSGGMKTVSIRGLGTQHTGVAYDGVMIGDVQGGQVDLSRYTLDNLSGLSLNIGDADDIFTPARQQSVAGTLNVSSMQTPDMMSRRPEARIRIKAGSFGLINPSFHLGLSNADNLGMTLAGDYQHARNNYPFTLRNGDEISRERRSNSQINSGHAEWNGIFKPSSASSLQAKLYWYESSRRLPGPVIYYNPESHERLSERNLLAQLAGRTRINDKISIKGIAKYSFGRTRYSDRNSIYPDGELDQRYNQKEEYLSATALYLPIKGLSLSYSADFWHNSLRSNLRGENRPLRNSLLQSISAKWKIWRMTATARGLYSLIHDRSNTGGAGSTVDRLSPSISISVQPIESFEWYIRSSYKDVMRMPTFNELYFDHYGSVNLRPEKAGQFNFGTTLSLSTGHSVFKSVELTADGYVNNVRNKIVAMPFNMFVWTMTNLGKVRILGVDATVNGDFRLTEKHDLLLSLNYSYQRAAARTDRATPDWNKQIPYIPLNSGAASLTWQNPWVNIVVHATACSSRYSTTLNIPSTRIAGYMELGFSAYRSVRLKSVELEGRLDLINALDKTYEIIARYPMPGRSLAFTVSIKL